MDANQDVLPAATRQANEAPSLAAQSKAGSVNDEAVIALLVDQSPAMLAYWNDDLTCRFANQAYRAWFGVQPDEIVGVHVRDLLGPALFEANLPYLQGVLGGQPQVFERTITTPAGEARDTLAHYRPHVVDGRVAGFMVLVTDVTRLKNTEAQLRREIAEREDGHHRLLAATKDLMNAQALGKIGSWEWDVAADVGRISAEMYRILGLDPGTAAPNHEGYLALFAPSSTRQLRAAVEHLLATGTPYCLELELRAPPEASCWVEARGAAVRDSDGTIVMLRGTIQDVTARRRLTAELAEQHELLRVTLQSIGEGVMTTNASGRVTWLNPVAERMTGWTTAEAQGCAAEDVFRVIHAETRRPCSHPVTRCLLDRRMVGLATHGVMVARGGREFGIEDSAAPIRNEAGDMLGVVLVFRDVSEQRRMSGEMTWRATHDALTGLENRTEFESRLLRLLQRAQTEGSVHALLYIDLDQFKLVNDACGHAVGDQLLQQVSRLLAEAVRSRDTVARLGGDEFAVILEHCSTAQAEQVAYKLCERMEEFRFVHEERRFRVGASIGIVPIDERWTTTAAIQRAADTACYAAKEAGRNRAHTWFDSDATMQLRHTEMQWTSRIESALDEDGFTLYVQQLRPLSANGGGALAEVLLRLPNRDGSLTLPGVFLPAAERFQLASRIDRWVLRRVLKWMRSAETLAPIEYLSINLSGQSVGDRVFQEWAQQALDEAGPELRARLCLEITETAAVTNPGDAAKFIARMRESGVKVALDDFGAGASSFGYLKTLPVDFLKIDGQFIRDLVSDRLDETAVQCFVAVAKVVGVSTVAEFVEHAEVLAKLKELGVDYAQGYLIHRPEPIDHWFAGLTAMPVQTA